MNNQQKFTKKLLYIAVISSLELSLAQAADLTSTSGAKAEILITGGNIARTFDTNIYFVAKG